MSLLCIIGLDGVCGWDLIEGGFNTKDYIEALVQITSGMIGRTRKQKRFLVMDNAPIHSKTLTIKTNEV